MAVNVQDWLDGVVGDHQFSPTKTYGNRNGNIVLRLQRPLVLESATGAQIPIGDVGTEVCIFRGYTTYRGVTLATIFEAERQVSILGGGRLKVRPYPSGIASE